MIISTKGNMGIKWRKYNFQLSFSALQDNMDVHILPKAANEHMSD